MSLTYLTITIAHEAKRTMKSPTVFYNNTCHLSDYAITNFRLKSNNDTWKQ